MMQNEPIRVLQINSGSRNFGGVSSFLYNVYTHIDREKVQFDFLSPNITTYGIHKDEIENLGGKIFELGITGNIIAKKVKLYFRLKKFLKDNPYKIVHINSGNFFFNLFAAKAVRAAGVKTCIVHSHNAGDTSHSKLKKTAFQILKPSLEKKADYLFACSVKAAEYMFTEDTVKNQKVSIIRNGIDIKRFVYDAGRRQKVRSELGLEDKIIVGHIGRFLAQKNHEFLIKVFSEIYKKEKNAVLLLFGTGELEEIIRKMVAELGLNDAVRFMGTVSNIEDMYQAMDVFVMPSFHEGLPVTCIELQVNGVPCVLSDTITTEVKFNDNVVFLPLDCGEAKWRDTALSLCDGGHEMNLAALEKAGYRIDDVVNDLTQRYINI